LGSIKQSIAWWCFARRGMIPEQLMRIAVEIGYEAVELIPQEHWSLAKDYGLRIASINGHTPIEKGLNRREHHVRIEQEIRRNLELAQRWNIANLIVFSGNRNGLDDSTGAKITAEGLQRVAGAAEEAGVTLVLELLNSKVDHRDYQCDHTAWGVEVCKMVGSERVKLLYDIYHMQIMEGDIIRTIRTYYPYFGHYHTAGNPGRHELDQRQELNYPAIIHAIRWTGYDGYLGQEFIPRGDVAAGLKQAFELCQVN
jgi:hydroxypyruvate isomerase